MARVSIFNTFRAATELKARVTPILSTVVVLFLFLFSAGRSKGGFPVGIAIWRLLKMYVRIAVVLLLLFFFFFTFVFPSGDLRILCIVIKGLCW